MQLQSDVCIFGSILSSAGYLDLIETNLRCALAAHILKSDRLAIQMTQGKAIHIVTAMRFEYIGLQQGIVLNAAQADTVIGKNMTVVFHILSDLGFAFVFQPRAQLLQHQVTRQLFRRILVTMSNRDIRREAGLATQRDANQLRLHRL